MLLYRCARALLYTLAVSASILFIAGRGQPNCMVTAFILIPVCVLLYFLQKALWMRANQRMPLVCVEAALVNHRQVYAGRVPNYKASYLTFETEHGEQLEFEVSREEFERIQLGAKGPLTYRGALYVSFRKPQAE